MYRAVIESILDVNLEGLIKNSFFIKEKVGVLSFKKTFFLNKL